MYRCLITCLMAALLAPACMATMSNVVQPTVAQKHGALHLKCDQSQVATTQIDDTTWKAEGCSQSVVLMCWTSAGQGDGTCVKQ
jgi:hypothetical protein